MYGALTNPIDICDSKATGPGAIELFDQVQRNVCAFEGYGQQFPPFPVANKDTLQLAPAQAKQDPAIRQEYEKRRFLGLARYVLASMRSGVFFLQEFVIGTLRGATWRCF